MADQVDEKATEIVNAVLTWEIVRANTDPKYVDNQAIREVLGFARKATRKALTVALRSVDTKAESRGFARGVAAAANLCVYLHRDGSVCLDRDGCMVDVVHQYYEPKGLERLIRALVPKEPKTDTADVEIEQRMDELFESD